MWNSKSVGNFGEIKTISKFIELGIPVYVAFGDNERCDLIAEFNGKLQKIQVKTANEETNGSIICPCRSSKNRTTNRFYDKYVNDVDYFVFYNQNRDLLALVSMEEIGNAAMISLRFEPTKNNQKNGVRFIEDFSFDKMLQKDWHYP